MDINTVTVLGDPCPFSTAFPERCCLCKYSRLVGLALSLSSVLLTHHEQFPRVKVADGKHPSFRHIFPSSHRWSTGQRRGHNLNDDEVFRRWWMWLLKRGFRRRGKYHSNGTRRNTGLSNHPPSTRSLPTTNTEECIDRIRWKRLWFRRWLGMYPIARWSSLSMTTWTRTNQPVHVYWISQNVLNILHRARQGGKRLDKTDLLFQFTSSWRNSPWQKGRCGRGKADGRWRLLFSRSNIWRPPSLPQFQNLVKTTSIQKVFKDGRTKKF